MTHSAKDAEFILPWAAVGAACPDALAYPRLEGFVHRGQSGQTAPNETLSLGADAPVAWSSSRFVRIQEGDVFRSVAVDISYYDDPLEATAFLRETARQMSANLRQDGAFVMAVRETSGPTASVVGLLAGKNLVVNIVQVASSGGGAALFCDETTFRQLFEIAKGNISALLITSLPSVARGATPEPAVWTEVKRLTSKEAGPPARTAEGQFYNNLWFDTPPLRQEFFFRIEHPWRIVVEIDGDVGTRYELQANVTRRDPPGGSTSSSSVFELSSPSAVHTFPDLSGQEPGETGVIHVTLSFTAPLEWNAGIQVVNAKPQTGVEALPTPEVWFLAGEPVTTLHSWSIRGKDYPIVSGIAGRQPEFWREFGYRDDAILVYLVDREVGCDNFPVDKDRRFPPLPADEGAMILLRFKIPVEENVDAWFEENSFSAGTDQARGAVRIVGSGEARRAQGWIEFDGSRSQWGSLPVFAAGTFDVPYCSDH